MLPETLVRLESVAHALPYVMVLHQAPTDSQDHNSFLSSDPSTVRKPGLLKYLAGPEISGEISLGTAPGKRRRSFRRYRRFTTSRRTGMPDVARFLEPMLAADRIRASVVDAMHSTGDG